MKFDTLIAEQLAKLDEAPVAPVANPAVAPDPNDPNAASQLPPSPEVGAAPPPEAMTPEGKVFLVDLARKALAFDPHQLPEFDREVLGAQVTADTADKVLKDIQRILGTN